MREAIDPMNDQEWVIWNGGLGLVTTAALGLVEFGPDGRQAWLEEPFDMVGPFSLDELETHGRIGFAACIVMSRQRWKADQAQLRHESVDQRRAAQQRTNGTFAHSSGKQPGYLGPPPTRDEDRHRQVLELPAAGRLERSQINTAFRRLAQRAHPDTGGSHDQFVRLTMARHMLIDTIS